MFFLIFLIFPNTVETHPTASIPQKLPLTLPHIYTKDPSKFDWGPVWTILAFFLASSAVFCAIYGLFVWYRMAEQRRKASREDCLERKCAHMQKCKEGKIPVYAYPNHAYPKISLDGSQSPFDHYELPHKSFPKVCSNFSHPSTLDKIDEISESINLDELEESLSPQSTISTVSSLTGLKPRSASITSCEDNIIFMKPIFPYQKSTPIEEIHRKSRERKNTM